MVRSKVSLLPMTRKKNSAKKNERKLKRNSSMQGNTGSPSERTIAPLAAAVPIQIMNRIMGAVIQELAKIDVICLKQVLILN